ncbi:MAG: hypothetical protein L3K05_07080, partial [Thermoplasmata archaeon]|nr:hypothetical protein [Thermoplasmata archaeon]
MGLGTIGAIAAVLLLLPVSAVGSLHANTGATVGEKRGALSEVGRAVLDTGRAPGGYRAGLLGTATISANGATGPSPAVTPPSGLVAAIGRNPTSPRVLGSFAGVNQATAGFAPPDPQVGQGGAYVFELVDEFGKITSTNGASVFANFTTPSFFGLPSTDNVNTGQVMYDTLSHRWIVAADDTTTNVEYYDVSKGSSPVGAWWAYYVIAYFSGGAAQYMNQPIWGVSQTMLAMGTNQYNTTTSAGYGALLTVVNKVKAENGHVAIQVLGYGGHYSIYPARDTSNNGSGPDVLYAANTGGGTTALTVYGVSGTVGSLSVSTIAYAIAFTGTPPAAKQAGTTTRISTGDGRVLSLSWSGLGVLWVASQSACRPHGDATIRSCIRVDAVDTGVNRLLQDNDTAVAGLYLYFGALTALRAIGSGYLMVVGYSGSLTYPSIAVTGQNSSDPFGTF